MKNLELLSVVMIHSLLFFVLADKEGCLFFHNMINTPIKTFQPLHNLQNYTFYPT